MEKKLFSWYTQLKSKNTPVTPKMIKQQALSITKFSDFIASKGWLEKFKRKFKLELSRENKIDVKKKIASKVVQTKQEMPTKNPAIIPNPNQEAPSIATNPNTPELKNK